LIESDQLSLSGSANELLPAERRIPNEVLESAFDATPEIDDVGGEILSGTWLVEVRQNGARAIE
jgi:hypothetical protein